MKEVIKDIFNNSYSDGTKISEVIERFWRIVYSNTRHFESDDKYLSVREEGCEYDAVRLFWNIYWITDFTNLT